MISVLDCFFFPLWGEGLSVSGVTANLFVKLYFLDLHSLFSHSYFALKVD